MRIYGKCSICSGGRDPEKKNWLKHICLSHPQVVALGWAATCVCFWISLHMYLVSNKYWHPRPSPPKPPPHTVELYEYTFIWGLRFFFRGFLANALVYEVSYSVITSIPTPLSANNVAWSVAEFIVPDGGHKVDSGIGFSDRPTRLVHRLAGGPVRQTYYGVNYIPPSRTMNLTTGREEEGSWTK